MFAGISIISMSVSDSIPLTRHQPRNCRLSTFQKLFVVGNMPSPLSLLSVEVKFWYEYKNAKRWITRWFTWFHFCISACTLLNARVGHLGQLTLIHLQQITKELLKLSQQAFNTYSTMIFQCYIAQFFGWRSSHLIMYRIVVFEFLSMQIQNTMRWFPLFRIARGIFFI